MGAWSVLAALWAVLAAAGGCTKATTNEDLDDGGTGVAGSGGGGGGNGSGGEAGSDASGAGAAGTAGSQDTDAAADAQGVDCENDSPTGASLDAARSQLESGATSVDLSPGGCFRYERVTAGGLVTSEKLTYAGQLALEYTRTASGTEGRGDFDLDGFFEWTYLLTRGASPAQDQAVFDALSPATQDVAERKTLTWSGDDIHVVIARSDGTGTLETVQEFDTPRYQSNTNDGGAQPRKLETEDCSDADGALIMQRLREAMDGDPSDPMSGGLPCLHRMKQSGTELRLTAAYAGHDVNIRCVPDLGMIAVYDGTGWFDTGTVTLRVNPTKFGKLTPAQQRHTLFHEMLHEVGEHDPAVLSLPRVAEIDPTEACAEMCWPNDFTTKCSCATCLKTDICDPRCAPFKPCNPELGAWCPCPGHRDYYATCSACLAGCPSGLACSFYSYCDPMSVECGSTPATCP